MKTAVSIPDGIFERAERLALQARRSRGEVEYDPYGGQEGYAGEVLERYITLERWKAPDGSVPAFPEIVAEESEIIPADALADADPDDEWIEEEMGNGGATAERAYRRTALALWPGRRRGAGAGRAGILSAAGFVTAGPGAESGRREPIRRPRRR